jgi:hypothetical protein
MDNNSNHLKADESTLVEFVLLIWREKTQLIFVGMLSILISLGIYLLKTPIHESSVTMLPQTQSADIGLLGKIASFSGTPLGGQQSYEGLYFKILDSDRMLSNLLSQSWMSAGHPDSVSLFEILNVEHGSDVGDKGLLADAKIKKKLREEVVFFYRDKLSGYMKLKVRLPNSPYVAADVANFLAMELDSYNKTVHTSKAREQREFVAERLENVQAVLVNSEREVADFVSANRSYKTSPLMVQRFNELEREVEAEYAVWVDLRRQLELARIDENKKMVSVDILDVAKPDIEKISPRLSVHVFSGVFFGLVFGVMFVFVRDQWRGRRRPIIES